MADKKNPYEVDGNVLYSRYYANKAPTTTTQQNPASLSDLYSQIMNRQKFSYDVGSDPLYQQYKDRYLQQGQTAMRDTMGQAAALTGGYGSSYAQGVGQQAYDRYVQGLNDKVPELYSMAYNRYRDEGNDLVQQYALAKDKEDTEYNRAQSEYQRLYSLIGSTGYEPTDAELQAAGMTREIANRLRTIALMKNPDLESINSKGMRVNNIVDVPAAAPAYYGGGGGGGKKADSGGSTPTAADYKAYMDYLEGQGYSKGSQLYQTADAAYKKALAAESKTRGGGTGGYTLSQR